MKKIVRVVWISVLSGLAFLAACCSQNGLSRKERKQLVKEREEVMLELDRNRSFEVDGPLEDYLSHRGTIYALEDKLDSINYRLGDSIDVGHNVRRRQILQRIDSLNYLIKNYIPPCIYGSPEMMAERPVDTTLDEYETALRKAQAELDALDRGEEAPLPEEMQPVIDPKKEAVPLYGVPRGDREKTRRLKENMDRASQVLYGSPTLR